MTDRIFIVTLFAVFSLMIPFSQTASAAVSDGTVDSQQKISSTAGGFTGPLDDFDRFGQSVADIGDLDGDGVNDLAVGAHRDDDGGTRTESNRGAVYILFMNTDGTVKSEQKISDTAGNFGGTLDDGDFFGYSVANIGDLDDDGVNDIAVGAIFDDDGPAPTTSETNKGAVYILFMNTDGTVKSHQKISATAGGFTGPLARNNVFGISVAGIGDLDGDGIEDIAVGSSGDSDGGTNHGAVYILFMNTDGTVKSQQKISDTAGDFDGILFRFGQFGSSLAGIGDLDGDGILDLAVGTNFDDDGVAFSKTGAVYILFMEADGTTKAGAAGFQKISNTAGNFGGGLDPIDHFGSSVANIGDLDGDGVIDLAVGAINDNGDGVNIGAVWILFMKTDGTVKSEQRITDSDGGFTGSFKDDVNNNFGWSAAGIGDLDGDGVNDLAVGARNDNDGFVPDPNDPFSFGGDLGAVWILFMKSSILDVAIDIKPGSDPSSVNCKNLKGNVPVAIFTDENFDATTIDIELVSMQLVGIDVIEVHEQLHPEDVDGDGDLDVVVHLGKAEVCDATSNLTLKETGFVTLTGTTTSGDAFEGIGDIRIVKR